MDIILLINRCSCQSVGIVNHDFRDQMFSYTCIAGGPEASIRSIEYHYLGERAG